MMEPAFTFTTVPTDAKPTKGTTCYFYPQRLKWRVSPSGITVTASGPASRVKHRQGAWLWVVKGHGAEPLPDWLEVPADLIDIAERAVWALRDYGVELPHQFD